MTSPLEHLGSGATARASGPATDPGATAVSIACAGCRRLVDAGAPCPYCGHSPVAAVPATRDLTVVLDPAPGDTMLLEPAPDPLAAPLPAPGPPVRRRRVPAGVLAAAAAVVLVAGVAVAGLRSGSDGGDRTAATGAQTAAAAAPRAVTAPRVTASSTQRPDGAISYAAANTLDGRPETAWNSDGIGAGASLTYTFAAPVDLASITVLNGYQKVRRGSSGAAVDLFALNQRVRALRVVTDDLTVDWNLRDARAPQTLSRAFGPTRTVRLQVLSTYPSRRYRDLAISEVRFGPTG